MKTKNNRSEEFKARQTALRIILISRRMMDYEWFKRGYTTKDILFDEEFFGYKEYYLLNTMFNDSTSIPFDSKKHYYNFLHSYSALPNVHYSNWNFIAGEELLPFRGGKKWVYWSRFGGDMRYSEIYYDAPKNGILPHFYTLDMESFCNQIKAWIDNGILYKGNPYTNEFDAFVNLLISHCFSNEYYISDLLMDDVLDENVLNCIYNEFDDMYDYEECLKLWGSSILKFKEEEL